MASVRAIRKNSGSILGVGGGLDAVHHFFGGDDFLPGTMAAALGADLISMGQAAAPNLISDFTVRAMLNALGPNPVSMSTISGRSHTSVMRRTSVSTSSRLLMPGPAG